MIDIESLRQLKIYLLWRGLSAYLLADWGIEPTSQPMHAEGQLANGSIKWLEAASRPRPSNCWRKDHLRQTEHPSALPASWHLASVNRGRESGPRIPRQDVLEVKDVGRGRYSGFPQSRRSGGVQSGPKSCGRICEPFLDRWWRHLQLRREDIFRCTVVRNPKLGEVSDIGSWIAV